MAQRCYFLNLIKQDCLLKTFLKNSNHNDSGVSLPAFPSKTNLKMNSIPKLVKKVITKLNSSKTSDPEYIPVVDLKKCATELSCTLPS